MLKQFWTWIILIATSLSMCWIAAWTIEDAGNHPYRGWQISSNKQRPVPLPAAPDWNFLPSLR